MKATTEAQLQQLPPKQKMLGAGILGNESVRACELRDFLSETLQKTHRVAKS